MPLHRTGVPVTISRGRLLSTVALLLVAGSASAQPEDARARAKDAYARGLRAHDAGDLRGAAVLFAEADALAPSPVALRAALDAAVDADDPALGAELLERSARGPVPPPLAESITAARGKLGGRAGRIRLDCERCTGTVDGRDLGTGWVAVGRHRVIVRAGAETNDVDVLVAAGAVVAVTGPAPASAPLPAPAPRVAPPPPPPASHGVSPTFVYGGGVVALSFAALAVVGGVMASRERDDFRERGCTSAPYRGCDDLQDSGRTYVLITNVLVGASIVTAIATTVVALVFTDWKRRPAPAQARGYLLSF